MYCRSCGTELSPAAVACTKCGVAPASGTNYCGNCGAATNPQALVCVSCGAGLGHSGGGASAQANNKLVAGLCGIFLGSLGVHKFVLGYQKEGVIMLLVTLVGGIVTCGAAAGVMSVIGLIEGIIYLTKSDADFVNMYVINRKPWF